jgi:Pheromone A receptor
MRSSVGVHSFLFYLTATRIQVAQNVAIPAASLCINRRLYKIATLKSVTITASEKRRAVMVDLLIGIGIPILQMISRESAWSVFLSRLFTRI